LITVSNDDNNNENDRHDIESNNNDNGNIINITMRQLTNREQQIDLTKS